MVAMIILSGATGLHPTYAKKLDRANEFLVLRVAPLLVIISLLLIPAVIIFGV